MEKKTNNKTSRASQTRAKTEKPKVWTPPSALDAPPAPDGYRHRWIRAESMGNDDSKNISGKTRSGWEFVRADEYPNDDYPSVETGKYAGVIGVGGLVLARIPEELAQQREAYYQQMTADRTEALDAPPAPDGYRHRWIRAESMGNDDSKNISGKTRSGWEFVRADEYPNEDYPSVETGKYAGVIGVGGLVLARIPEELAQQREAYYQQMTADRTEALDNDVLKEQHPSMPINQERQTRVTFGGTKK